MKKLFIYNLLFLFALAGKGQDVKVLAEFPSVVEAGQQFSVSWTVNTGGGEFSAPSFAGFSKLMGPQTSYSDSRQFINGKWSQETTYTYVYYLQAVNEGKFTIPPAVFTLKNKTFSSDSMHIEVINGSVQQGATSDQTKTNPETNGKDIFIDLSLSRKDVYIGEHIVAILKIFTRVNLAGINEIKYPAFNEFLKTDLETPPLNSLDQESINGTKYGTGVLQQFLLYPQVTGQVTIDPVQINALVQQKVGQSDPFFGDFFSTYQSVPRAIASKPVTINVRPLPGTKPDDFSGIVGIINLKAGISKDSVNVNDAVNYKITVSGSGNLKLAAAPVLKLSPDIEVYDPKVTDNLKNNVSGTSGQKTFDFLLIPRHYGDFTIPPVTYSYFNTSTGKYERFTTEEFQIHARKGSEPAPGITVYGGVSKEDVKYVGKDIRFIKTDPGKLSKSTDLIVSKRSFASSYAIALLAFLIILFVRREHIRRNSDLTVVKNRKAGKVAVRRLVNASACLKRGEIDRFHEEILKSLWGYLSDKLNIPVSDLTRNNAVISLTEKGIGEDMIRSLTDILDKCEYARYAPSASGTEASEIYEDASLFIRSVENSIG
jgi:hypothetical protein